ncbi:MAG: TlpA family protein disulfide reductase [Planctomycetes bacterium]|nr:TlpA family protein disulfide reductase [Planctomycetota bacterium]
MGSSRPLLPGFAATLVLAAAAVADPELDLKAYRDLGEAVGSLGRPKTQAEYETLLRKSVALYERYLEEYPGSVYVEKVQWVLHTTYLALGEKGQAARILDEVSDGAVRQLIQVAFARRGTGEGARAGEVLEGLLAASGDTRVRSLVAQYLYVTGEKDRAMEILGACIAGEGDGERRAFALHIQAGLLRGDPRRTAILERIVTEFEDTRIARDARRELAAARLTVGSDPLAFAATDLEGRAVSPAALRGKVAVLWFWSARSPACLRELPAMKELWREFSDRGLALIGVSCDEIVADVRSFVAAEALGWPQVADGRGWHTPLARIYDVQSLPYAVVIGRDGKIGALGPPAADLRRTVRALLAR